MKLKSLADCNSNAVQAVRLFVDVLFLGPLLVWLGLNPGRSVPPVVSFLLVVTGIATVVFNGVNFFLIMGRRA